MVQSDPAKQLLLLSLLHKNGRLSRSQLTTLKVRVVPPRTPSPPATKKVS